MFIKLTLKTLLYFHRLIGITFNGLSFDNNFEVNQNNALKYYGYVSILFHILCNIAKQMMNPYTFFGPEIPKYISYFGISGPKKV